MATDKKLRLILGDQLNENHNWFQKPDKAVTYVLMEIRQETDYVKHHVQKVMAFFAAMRAFAEKLKEKGHAVIYLRLDDSQNQQTIAGNIKQLLKKKQYARFEYLLPDEYRLDVELQEMVKALPVSWEAVDTEHFLTRREDFKDFFVGKKRYLMESFYRQMRKKHDILMDGDKPQGGRWNFDVENRRRYDGRVPIPKPKLFRNDVSALHKMIEKAGVKTFGHIKPKSLIWPINRSQSLALLKAFLKDGLKEFGTYQDSMTTASWSLFHARISFALNTKMLHPLEVIEAAMRAWEKNKRSIKIQQIEGFVRQILGWREYMRGIYWTMMPKLGRMNFFNHRAALPDYYWTAETKMKCMQAAIGQSLEHAYAHHIQRLMVTGNFALLAGVHPDQVEEWYLGVYIDAIQWVEMPNTRAMSQWADGGLVATKPYVSSANYIHKMSDYCSQCHYDRQKPFGESACPFNCLFWDFFDRHRQKLENNPRIGMMYRTWYRKDPKDQQRILKQAEAYKKDLNRL
ncbi:MAG: cryptochrome/photolyase family protein [Desulfobacterales bacterium]|jgi:deoxyribodipyrimidine photolyase-related protein|nr:cryptochrome/photolyase family protein [Deltaproteobacteria bacterium]